MAIWLSFMFLISAFACVTGRWPTAFDVAKELNAKVVKAALQSSCMSTSIDGTDSCKPDETTCDKDVLTVCGMQREKVTIPCSQMFDGKGGYCDCDNVQCVQERPLCTGFEDLACSSPGQKMPDPNNCHQFSYCDESNQKSIIECPGGLVYNATAEQCTDQKICPKLVCNRKKIAEWIPFPQYPEYFLICLYGKGEVRKCHQEGYRMEGGRCQFSCTKVGLYKDPSVENCKKGMWHVCTKRGNVIVRETKYCPPQKYFNEKIGVCDVQNTCESDTPPQEEPPSDNE